MEGKIFKAMSEIMADIGAIGKNNRNKDQGFMYRGIDAVMNAINPSLVKHNVFIIPEVLEQTREERKSSKGSTLIYSVCRIKFRFYADDGSFVEAITIGEGMDTGDKATNKAMSIAYKYACFQAFCIPTEEMKDPDAESYEVTSRNQGVQPYMPQQPNYQQLQNNATVGGYGAPRQDPNSQMMEQANASIIDANKLAVLRKAMQDVRCMEQSVLSRYCLSKLEDMNLGQWNSAMKILNGMKAK